MLFFASLRNFPSCRPACTPLHPRPACLAFLQVHSSYFHGSRGVPQPCSSSTTCVGAFLTSHIHILIGRPCSVFCSRASLNRHSLGVRSRHIRATSLRSSQSPCATFETSKNSHTQICRGRTHGKSPSTRGESAKVWGMSPRPYKASGSHASSHT